MSATRGADRKGSLLPLWAMLVVFAMPVVAAWFLYFNPEYLPTARTNRGELISPVVPLPAGPWLQTLSGGELDREALAGKWTLVFLAGGGCEETCIHRLGDLRQIRLALGENRLGVERLLIFMEPTSNARVSELARDFDGMRVAVADPSGGKQLLGLLGEGSAALGRVYILDPMGNLMMRYPPDAPAKDTLKDMERLLKASKNWIKGAQYGHE